MSGKQVIAAALKLPLSDEHWDTSSQSERSGRLFQPGGGGMVCALKAAAGDDVDAYNAAYCRVSAATSLELGPYRYNDGSRDSGGPVSRWASVKSAEERKALLRGLL